MLPAKADLFSFGMLLWEVLHVAIPFATHNCMQAVSTVQQGGRPMITLSAPLDHYAPLINSCWHPDPSLRPPISAVVEELKGRPAELSKEPSFASTSGTIMSTSTA